MRLLAYELAQNNKPPEQFCSPKSILEFDLTKNCFILYIYHNPKCLYKCGRCLYFNKRFNHVHRTHSRLQSPYAHETTLLNIMKLCLIFPLKLNCLIKETNSLIEQYSRHAQDHLRQCNTDSVVYGMT